MTFNKTLFYTLVSISCTKIYYFEEPHYKVLILSSATCFVEIFYKH